MTDLSRGYLGNAKGNCLVVDAILRQAPLNLGLPGHWLVKAFFNNNFMPYAKAHWAYEGSTCHCEDLSNALLAAWDYMKSKRPGGLDVLPRAEKVGCPFGGGGIITRALPVFAGPARGNIRRQRTGATDGRCLFPIHYMCKIGASFLDPTYDRITSLLEDCVERRLIKESCPPFFWLAADRHLLYVRNTADPAPGFSDSWQELDTTGWIRADAWKLKTARSGHTRSSDLQRVDAALLAFESQGASALPGLKTTFKHWADHNPKEAFARNVDNCVGGLAGFLDVAVNLRA